MLSFAVATPSMLKMDTLPMFVCGGPGKFAPDSEEKQALVEEYVNHLRVHVLETITAEAASPPSLTASVNLHDVIKQQSTEA